jgi:translation initiation factor 1
MGRKDKPKKINLEDLGGFVFSTNPDFEAPADQYEEFFDPYKQILHCHFEKKGRGGKQVVIIKGFEGPEDQLKELGKQLRQHCGVGGSAKNGEILLQGNVRDKAMDKLKSLGYRTKRIGG